MTRDCCSRVDAGRSGLEVDERNRKNDGDNDSDDAPETPADQPRPSRVQDPPPQEDTQVPYVVQFNSVFTSSHETEAQS